jgi:hypothetical protein
LAANEIVRQLWQAIVSRDVLTFNITFFAQSTPERRGEIACRFTFHAA